MLYKGPCRCSGAIGRSGLGAAQKLSPMTASASLADPSIKSHPSRLSIPQPAKASRLQPRSFLDHDTLLPHPQGPGKEQCLVDS